MGSRAASKLHSPAVAGHNRNEVHRERVGFRLKFDPDQKRNAYTVSAFAACCSRLADRKVKLLAPWNPLGSWKLYEESRRFPHDICLTGMHKKRYGS